MNIGFEHLRPKTGSVDARTHSTEDKYPQLKLKVLIIGNCFLSGAVEMFAKAGCTRAKDMADADLVVFLGGEDVDPSLYGEKKMSGTYINKARDEAEMDVFANALELEKPMFGICRGMQFLHVMNGGKLYQDVTNHGMTHAIRDCNTGRIIRASSMHHQMCIVDDSMFPLAYAWTGSMEGVADEVSAWSGVYATPSKTITDPNHLDLEAGVYPAINAIAVQGHPEIGGYPDFTAWCLEQIDEFVHGGDTFTVAKSEPKKIDPSLPFLNRGVSI